AKRILFVGGGKARNFSTSELRKVAGTAVRFLKAKNLRSFAFLNTESSKYGMPEAIKSIVEGAIAADFDPDYYRSDRKDQKLDAFTVLVSAAADVKSLEHAAEVGRIIGESQSFTRDLVNEPGNRMTPMILANRAKKMSDEVGLKCEIYGADKIK